MNDRERKILFRCIAALLLAAVALGVAYAVGRWIETGMGAENSVTGDLSYRDRPVVELNGQRYRLRRGITTILVMGVDREEGAEGVTGFRNGGQADFLLLLVMDSEQKTLHTIQIDRDTIAEITVLGVLGNVAGTRSAQISLSHGFGDGGEQSCLLTADAVSKLLYGVEIPLYAALNLDAISALNDLLGGITVTLEDDFSQLDPQMRAGETIRLVGQQAEYYVRGRMSVGIGTNEARMERQRVYMEEAWRLLEEKLRANVSFMGEVYDVLGESLVTNMTRGRMINEANAASGYERSSILVPEGEHRVGEDGFMEFHADEDALLQTVLSLFYETV